MTKQHQNGSHHTQAGLLAFLNAGLSALGDRLVNERIIQILRDEGMRVFAPQVELPLGAKLTPFEILDANERGIQTSSVIVSVFDKPGLGVAYELGVARRLGKPIIAFRTEFQPYLGKIMEGVWDSISTERRATNFDELRSVVRTFVHTQAMQHDPL